MAADLRDGLRLAKLAELLTGTLAADLRGTCLPDDACLIGTGSSFMPSSLPAHASPCCL
jgi:hypothetical protein